MRSRQQIIFISCLLSLLLSFGAAALAGPTGAYTPLSNNARIFAVNYFHTNWAGTNLIVAEIHGVMDLVSTNTNGLVAPGGAAASFSNFLTNKANLREKKFLLILTNGLTNSSVGCGNWTIEVLSNSKRVFTNTSRSLCVPNGVQRFLLDGMSLPPGGIFVPGVRLSAPLDAGPNAWVSVQLITRVTTNAASYVALDGTPYGGKTNALVLARAEVAAPNITLFKFIDKVTNLSTKLNDPVPGSEIWYRIAFSNSGIGQGKNLTIIDFLPMTNIVFLSNSLAFQGFATNFTVLSRNRADFPIQLVSVDSNVRKIIFSTVKIFDPGDSSKGVITYKIRIR